MTLPYEINCFDWVKCTKPTLKKTYIDVIKVNNHKFSFMGHLYATEITMSKQL